MIEVYRKRQAKMRCEKDGMRKASTTTTTPTEMAEKLKAIEKVKSIAWQEITKTTRHVSKCVKKSDTADI